MPERIVRGALGVLGMAAAVWGLHLLWVDRPYIKTLNFGEWLISGILLHDLIIANVVLLVGWLLAKLLPPHLRGFVQGALLVIALVGSVAFFVVWRQGTASSPSLALLRQNYVANFGIIAAVVVVCTAVLYVLSLRTMRKSRPE
ncbi:hypothetical protein [Allobranchiibius huperziae]|uniref:Putative neutral ceramidase superfamily lipid hydrolase n=1 Tax=Allobranchiibius huperziae TaxID=1874116 RepID=A0A853DL93_9MICO|nr:hypothetical protein [Allobranchiibius huperziae]NYJ75774.1 putative neutral ceramidase superfamily lipid hydrolase [Allobranchiibius huperziae]